MNRKALVTLFPEHSWKIHKFEHVPDGFWTSEENRRVFFDDISKTLGIKQMEDWYSVQKEDIVKVGGGGDFV